VPRSERIQGCHARPVRRASIDGVTGGGTSWAAYLRVYEPLAAFAGAERARWETYVASGAAPEREAGAEQEHAAAVRALVPATLPDVGEQAYVLQVDGVTLVCPWRTRLRAQEALLDFRSGLPDEVADAFLPRGLAETAEAELEELRLADPGLRTHVLSSPWQVPLRWFVLVEADERSAAPGSPGEGGAPPGRRTGRQLLYRTPMSRARRRVARALAVLRAAVDDGEVTQGVEDLGRWLEEFHPRSLVELDYGGLVHLLEDGELMQDESARDIAAALAALADGEPVRAAAAYSRVTARMKALQAVESAN
jgi:hypothetical protein